MPKLPEIMPKPQWPASFTPTRFAFALKIAIIIAATLTVFHQDLVLIFSDALQNETTSYILAVPFILVYLVYRKRKMLRTIMPLTGQDQPRNTRYLASTSGILLTATAVLLYWHGSYTFSPVEYHMFALPLFTAGLCLILFNPQTLRQLAFPIAFLFFLMPPPSEILHAAGSTLQVVSAQASNAIVNAFNIPSALTMESGNPLITLTAADGTPLPFSLDIACSGIYSLIGFTVFAVFIAYIIRNNPWKKAALLIIGIPLVYFLNVVRITTMLFIGYNYGSALALQTFHTLGGWVLIFLGTLVLLLISEKAFKTRIFSKPAAKCVQCIPELQPDRDYCRGCGRIIRPATARLHKSDAVKLAAIILTAGLLVTIQAPVFALTQGLPIITFNTPSGQQFSTQVLPQTDQYTLTFLYEATYHEVQAKQDMSLRYLYAPVNESGEPIQASLEIASTQSSLHGWETSARALRDIQLTQNARALYFVFQDKADRTWAVLYWHSSTVFMINSTVQTKHVGISLIAFPSSMDELPRLEVQLVTLATAIADYWQPIQTWSETTLIISQNGITLSAATSIALALTLFYYEAEARKRRKASLTAAAKLTSSSRDIVGAVQKTKKPATLENLAATLQKGTGQKPITEQLERRLQELEKTGIIKASVHSQNDEPVQTWKT